MFEGPYMTLQFNDEPQKPKTKARKTPALMFIIDEKTDRMINRLASKHKRSRSAIVRAAIAAAFASEVNR